MGEAWRVLVQRVGGRWKACVWMPAREVKAQHEDTCAEVVEAEHGQDGCGERLEGETCVGQHEDLCACIDEAGREECERHHRETKCEEAY